ncbi:hypothetical protein [Janthinobacterium psychrotolerans]|uniref:Bacteriophage Rz lysis protein n=1 Tax=Janthinobacterium psychrotolerans TaxID=1747903 RepID=A0A1A7CBJ0_9BURK|nr:hypothetical protein [Janthinobacterium psychrotolerans]OBV41673.1 hypothetical protein ASR47_10428 [Janthinobacterium psychrotolerans]
MSGASALAGAAVSGIWKAAAIVLAAVLLVVAGATGTGWWLAAGARDQALVDLKAEQSVSAGLRASIAEQNLAVDGMARATLAAQQRGEAAQAAAAAAGKKYQAAQVQLAGVRATTCDEAMPAVRAMLENVQ